MKKTLLIICSFLFTININASIVVMDSKTNRVLYSENKDEKKLIASTTKIMTSLIAIENSNLYETFTAKKEINEVYGSMIYIKENEQMTLIDLLYGLNLRSGNDAAMVIATNVLGYDKFINKMNEKAKQLKMYNTTFENPHGLNDDSRNYSTAYDLSLLMSYAIKNKTFIEISSTKKYKTNSNNTEYIWYNKNKLLSMYKYTIAGKIGYTKESGQVFVSSAYKDGINLVISSIDESDKFNLHKNLYEKYFDLYKNYKILDKYTFSINDSKYNNYYFYINEDVYLTLTKEELDKLKIKAKINNKLSNNCAGYLEFIIDDNIIYKEKLYYEEYKERNNKIKNILKNILLRI